MKKIALNVLKILRGLWLYLVIPYVLYSLTMLSVYNNTRLDVFEQYLGNVIGRLTFIELYLGERDRE